MGRWPVPGESLGIPRYHCRLTCRPSCPVNAAARGNPPTLCGQRSVTVGAGRPGLAQHFRLKRHCEWRQCEVRSISLASSTHSVYVHRTQPVESRSYCSPSLVNFTSHRASAGRSAEVQRYASIVLWNILLQTHHYRSCENGENVLHVTLKASDVTLHYGWPQMCVVH